MNLGQRRALARLPFTAVPTYIYLHSCTVLQCSGGSADSALYCVPINRSAVRAMRWDKRVICRWTRRVWVVEISAGMRYYILFDDVRVEALTAEFWR